jgi:hypothetical protein
MSALGHYQTSALHKGMSASPPIATVKADMPQPVMSALPPKADMCGANRDVRYGPIADIGSASDEHSNAWQDNPDLGELARPRIHLD